MAGLFSRLKNKVKNRVNTGLRASGAPGTGASRDAAVASAVARDTGTLKPTTVPKKKFKSFQKPRF